GGAGGRGGGLVGRGGGRRKGGGGRGAVEHGGDAGRRPAGDPAALRRSRNDDRRRHGRCARWLYQIRNRQVVEGHQGRRHPCSGLVNGTTQTRVCFWRQSG